MESRMRWLLALRSPALVQAHGIVHVSNGGANVNAESIGVAVVEIEPGIMECNDCRRESQLDGTRQIARHRLTVEHVPLEAEVLHLGADLRWRARHIAERDRAKAMLPGDERLPESVPIGADGAHGPDPGDDHSGRTHDDDAPSQRRNANTAFIPPNANELDNAYSASAGRA